MSDDLPHLIKQKSVRYPYNSLSEAKEFTNKAHKIIGRSSVSVEDLAHSLNTNFKTKSFAYSLSSAIQFGLMERDKDRYRITPLGNSILYPPEGLASLQSDLRRAFLNPPFYRKIIERYQDLPLPEETILQNVFQNLGIVPSVLSEAVKAFMDSATFANVLKEGNRILLEDITLPQISASKEMKANIEPIQPSQPERSDQNGSLLKMELTKQIVTTKMATLHEVSNAHYLEFMTISGEKIKAVVPISIVKGDIERFYKMLEILIRKEEK